MNMPYTGAKTRVALSFRPASGDDLELRYFVLPFTVTFGQVAWIAADVAEAIYYMLYFYAVFAEVVMDPAVLATPFDGAATGETGTTAAGAVLLAQKR
jgi:hypothetical protein